MIILKEEWVRVAAYDCQEGKAGQGKSINITVVYLLEMYP